MSLFIVFCLNSYQASLAAKLQLYEQLELVVAPPYAETTMEYTLKFRL